MTKTETIRENSKKTIENKVIKRESKKVKGIFTDDELLSFLKQFYEENGRPPSQADFSNNSEYPNYSVYVNRFSSWSNAKAKAGFAHGCQKYTNEQLLNYLKQFNDENGRLPKQKDFDNNTKYPESSIYFKRFGGWEEAFKMAGFMYTNIKYTDQELLDFLRKYYRENGRAPARRDFVNNSIYPSFPNYDRFGGWRNALKLVDLDMDSQIRDGFLDNESQKGRKAELSVINHFIKNPVDLSGQNPSSNCDGICPNGMIYDVKSRGLFENHFSFVFRNIRKEKIEIYYLLGFDENYTELLYGWRVPKSVISDKDHIRVYLLSDKAEFSIESMKKYEITNKLKVIVKKDNDKEELV